jgi:hypothetical protein
VSSIQEDEKGGRKRVEKRDREVEKREERGERTV